MACGGRLRATALLLSLSHRGEKSRRRNPGQHFPSPFCNCSHASQSQSAQVCALTLRHRDLRLWVLTPLSGTSELREQKSRTRNAKKEEKLLNG